MRGVRDARPFLGPGRAPAPSERRAPLGTSPRLGEARLSAPAPAAGRRGARSFPRPNSMLYALPFLLFLSRGALEAPILPVPPGGGGGGLWLSASPPAEDSQSQAPRGSFFHPHLRYALNRSQAGLGRHGSEEWGQCRGFPPGNPSRPGPRGGEDAAGRRGGRRESGTAQPGSDQNWAGGGVLFRRQIIQFPWPRTPSWTRREAARAGVSVAEAGSEARAGLRGELPDRGCARCWGCWSRPLVPPRPCCSKSRCGDPLE